MPGATFHNVIVGTRCIFCAHLTAENTCHKVWLEMEMLDEGIAI